MLHIIAGNYINWGAISFEYENYNYAILPDVNIIKCCQIHSHLNAWGYKFVTGQAVIMVWVL